MSKKLESIPSNTKIFYTGSSGHLGSQVAVIGGRSVVPLDTPLESDVMARVKDLQNTGELNTPNKVLIHLAALVNVQECEQNPEKAKLLNVEGALKWFEAAEKCGFNRFVYASTAHVFAAPLNKEKLNITSPVAPRSVYAKTKLQGEMALQTAAHKSKTQLCVARIFSVLSPNMRQGFLLHTLKEKAVKKDYSPIAGFGNVRDFLWADEVCHRLLRLALTTQHIPLALICSGEGVSVKELAEKIFQENGADPSKLVGGPSRPDDIPYMVGVPTIL